MSTKEVHVLWVYDEDEGEAKLLKAYIEDALDRAKEDLELGEKFSPSHITWKLEAVTLLDGIPVATPTGAEFEVVSEEARAKALAQLTEKLQKLKDLITLYREKCDCGHYNGGPCVLCKVEV